MGIQNFPARTKSKLRTRTKLKLRKRTKSKLRTCFKSKLRTRTKSKLRARTKSKLRARTKSKLRTRIKSKLRTRANYFDFVFSMQGRFKFFILCSSSNRLLRLTFRFNLGQDLLPGLFFMSQKIHQSPGIHVPKMHKFLPRILQRPIKYSSILVKTTKLTLKLDKITIFSK